MAAFSDDSLDNIFTLPQFDHLLDSNENETGETNNVTFDLGVNVKPDSDSKEIEQNLPDPIPATVKADENKENHSRFPSLVKDEVDGIAKMCCEKSTDYQTKWGVKLFKDWLMSRQELPNFEILPAKELSALLRRFYAEARTKTGTPYSRTAMQSIRSAIQRHLLRPPYNRTISIISDPDFKPANLVFTGRLKQNRAEGHDKTKHKDCPHFL